MYTEYQLTGRQPSVSPYLWVDAISINQENVLERNHQVQFMQRIFSSAKLVLVWIGSHGPSVHIAVQEMTARKPLHPDQKNLDHLTPTTMGALGTLFSQPYWTRMWIIQEFVVAKDMRFLYGDEHFSWNDFRCTMLYLDDSNVAIHCQAHKVTAVRNNHRYILMSSAFSVYRTRKLYKSLACFSIFELISAYHKQECSDPRDKVFALLGLAEATIGIRADYTLSKEKLLEQMVDAFEQRVDAVEQKLTASELTKLLRRILGL
jgi:hypothetical protein